MKVETNVGDLKQSTPMGLSLRKVGLRYLFLRVGNAHPFTGIILYNTHTHHTCDFTSPSSHPMQLRCNL